jgi:hypothetical protein
VGSDAEDELDQQDVASEFTLGTLEISKDVSIAVSHYAIKHKKKGSLTQIFE